MAQKRMFSLNVVDTDLFLEMPITSRLLYYELGMRADDDGFVDDWKKILKFTGLAEDDMKILIAKNFIIPFESGVIVIRHWRLNNYLRNDRHTATTHKEEFNMLVLDGDIYELESTEKSTMLPSGIPVVYTDKNRLDKNRLDKNSKEKNIKEKKVAFVPPTLEEVKNYIAEKNLGVDANQFYDYFTEGNWVDAKGQKVKNWKQKLLTWNRYNNNKQRGNTRGAKFSDLLEGDEFYDEEGNNADTNNSSSVVYEVLPKHDAE